MPSIGSDLLPNYTSLLDSDLTPLLRKQNSNCLRVERKCFSLLVFVDVLHTSDATICSMSSECFNTSELHNHPSTKRSDIKASFDIGKWSNHLCNAPMYVFELLFLATCTFW